MTVMHSAYLVSPAAMSGATSGSGANAAGCVGAPFVKLPAGYRLDAASAGDHLPIRALLSESGWELSESEFQAQLDEPRYEPTDRLVARHGLSIIGHVHLRNHEMRFGATTIPVASLTGLVTAPDYRRRGIGSALVDAAERQARADGADIVLVRAARPNLFLRRGWACWSRPCYSHASTRDILAQIVGQRVEQAPNVDEILHGHRPLPISTRLWRHVEQSALERIYEHHSRHAFGPWVRGEEYWRWLVSRHGFDAIYVAIAGRDRWSLDGKGIVGYAVVKQDRVVELYASPERPDAAESLMTRLCGEFIEQDRCDLRLDVAPDHPWHQRLVAAGGVLASPESENGHFTLARIFDPAQFLERLRPELARRASLAQLPVGAELPLVSENLAMRLRVAREESGQLDVRLEPWDGDRQSRADAFHCDSTALTQVLLGHLDVHALVASGHAVAPSRELLQLAGLLFPKLPLWRPLWDDLPSVTESGHR